MEGNSSGVGVSASNSGRGHDPVAIESDGDFVPTNISGSLEEEPSAIEDDALLANLPSMAVVLPNWARGPTQPLSEAHGRSCASVCALFVAPDGFASSRCAALVLQGPFSI